MDAITAQLVERCFNARPNCPTSIMELLFPVDDVMENVIHARLRFTQCFQSEDRFDAARARAIKPSHSIHEFRASVRYSSRQLGRYPRYQLCLDGSAHFIIAYSKAQFVKLSDMLGWGEGLWDRNGLEEEVGANLARENFALKPVFFARQNVEKIGFTLKSNLMLNRVPSDNGCKQSHKSAQHVSRETKPIFQLDAFLGNRDRYANREKNGENRSEREKPYSSKSLIPTFHHRTLHFGHAALECTRIPWSRLCLREQLGAGLRA